MLTFGKYKGRELIAVPSSYLGWLMDPVLKTGGAFHVPADVQADARTMLEHRLYAQGRLIGEVSDRTDYIFEGFGDLDSVDYNGGFKAGLHEPLGFPSLHDALTWLEKWAIDDEGWIVLDPEDDKVLLWEVLPSGHKKVVWGFFGWHWDQETYEQGHFEGHEKAVYTEANDL